jgi:hypothetical protein
MMGKHDGFKMLALRVQNKTRGCVLLKKHSNGIWAMPTIVIPYADDAADHLGDVSKFVAKGSDFEFISAVSILDWVQEDRNGTDHYSIIYDLRYAGKVLPHLTEACRDKFTESKWVQKGMLDNYKDKCNYPLYAYLEAVGKEKCLA